METNKEIENLVFKSLFEQGKIWFKHMMFEELTEIDVLKGYIYLSMYHNRKNDQSNDLLTKLVQSINGDLKGVHFQFQISLSEKELLQIYQRNPEIKTYLEAFQTAFETPELLDNIHVDIGEEETEPASERDLTREQHDNLKGLIGILHNTAVPPPSPNRVKRSGTAAEQIYNHEKEEIKAFCSYSLATLSRESIEDLEKEIEHKAKIAALGFVFDHFNFGRELSEFCKKKLSYLLDASFLLHCHFFKCFIRFFYEGDLANYSDFLLKITHGAKDDFLTKLYLATQRKDMNFFKSLYLCHHFNKMPVFYTRLPDQNNFDNFSNFYSNILSAVLSECLDKWEEKIRNKPSLSFIFSKKNETTAVITEVQSMKEFFMDAEFLGLKLEERLEGVKKVLKDLDPPSRSRASTMTDDSETPAIKASSRGVSPSQAKKRSNTGDLASFSLAESLKHLTIQNPKSSGSDSGSTDATPKTLERKSLTSNSSS